MSSDTEKHRALLSALKDAQGKGDGAFERAVTMPSSTSSTIRHA